MKNRCIRIVKRKIPKDTLKKYGWKNPNYYEVKRGPIRLTWSESLKEAKKWAKRYGYGICK